MKIYAKFMEPGVSVTEKICVCTGHVHEAVQPAGSALLQVRLRLELLPRACLATCGYGGCCGGCGCEPAIICCWNALKRIGLLSCICNCCCCSISCWFVCCW